MTKPQQAEIDAAKEDVVEAAKAWRHSYARHREEARACLVGAVERLNGLESAATQGLPARGKMTLLTGVNYRGRAVPSRAEDEKENNAQHQKTD